MCYEVSKNEWCGILFYRMEGSLEEPDSLKFDVIGLYPMHIGTSGGTTIEDYEEVLDYFDKFPHMEDDDIRHGFIHSHNSMETFFSGTDNKQLEDGAEDYDLFLSVITNNAQDYVAKISFQYEEERSQKILGFDLGFTQKNSGVGTLECKVRYEMCAHESEFFEDRVKELRQKKNTSHTTTYSGYNGHYRGSEYYNKRQWNPKTRKWELKDEESDDGNQKDLFSSDDKPLWDEATEQYPPDDFPVIYANGVDTKRPYLAGSYLLKKLCLQFHITPQESISSNVDGLRKQVADVFSDLNERRFKLYYANGVATLKETGDKIIEEMDNTGYGYREILGGLITIDTILRKDVKVFHNEQKVMKDLLNTLLYLFEEYSLRVDVEILEQEGKDLEGPSDLQLVNGNEQE